MIVSYPALFFWDEEVEGYFVTFPDFENSATQGDDIADALFMASEYLGIMIASYVEKGSIVPKPSFISDVSLSSFLENDDDLKLYYGSDRDFISMVVVDVSSYLSNDRLVKKTLSIPKWANDYGNKHCINFSKLLTDNIKKLIIE